MISPADGSTDFLLPASLLDSALERTDFWGRHKIVAQKEAAQMPDEKTVRKAFTSTSARIEKNHFKYKSLSCWSYNIAIGCAHACRFCYVPSTQQSGNSKDGTSNGGRLNQTLKLYGVNDPDEEWGQYVQLRGWNEKRFRASLRKWENIGAEERDGKGRPFLNPDGNRAVFFCSTTDPFQLIRNPNPEKQKLLNGLRKALICRALELILTESTLNVRILTRSSPGPEEWALIKKLSNQNRVLFGVSLPTSNERLASIYEPKAPGSQARLRTLEKAVEMGIPVYVAMAPTYPECDEADLRKTLTAVRKLSPVTVFHEPINVRAENVERIRKHARSLGMEAELKSEVFQDAVSWRIYAITQLQMVERMAREVGLADQLHLWPDPKLGVQSSFLKMRQQLLQTQYPDARLSRLALKERRELDKKVFAEDYLPWLNRYWTMISAWPGKGKP